MSDRDDSQADPLGALAEEFVERVRNGERPELSEYTAKFPELADDIREMFPLLVMMEQANSEGSSSNDNHSRTDEQKLDIEQLPESIAGYKILREIGRGGMGVVYEAEQIALRRQVALKVLPKSALTDEAGVNRFQHEARVAASLHHTNIVPVFEVGQDNDLCFYSMQYIRGHSLDKVVAELRDTRHRHPKTTEPKPLPTRIDKPQSIREVANTLLGASTQPFSLPNLQDNTELGDAGNTILLPGQESPTTSSGASRPYHRSIALVGVQVADALDYTHRNGVLHRDIKPANLLLDGQSRVWITDFGLAKTQDTELTREGDVVGTLRYMAPERFRGECTARSDLFSLGVALYEMLLLRPAFDARDHPSLIRQITHSNPASIRTIDPTVPLDLETIVMKCLEKDPRRRYTSASELADDLRRFLDNRPIHARRISYFEHFWRWCVRNPVVASLSLCTLVVALIGFVGILLQWQRANKNERQAIHQREQAIRHANDAIRKRDEIRRSKKELAQTHEQLRRVSYNSSLNLAGNAWRKGELSHVRKLLEMWKPAPDQTDLRGFEWYYLHALSRANTLTLTQHEHPILSMSYSPVGNRIATLDIQGHILVWNSKTGQVESSFTPRGLVRGTSLRFDPKGQLLAVGNSDQSITLRDASTFEIRGSLLGKSGIVRGLRFSPDGKFLATVSTTNTKDGNLIVWNLETNQQRWTFAKCTAGYGALAYSQDGKHIAIVTKQRSIARLDSNTGDVIQEFAPLRKPIFGIELSPNGKVLALGTGDNNVELIDFQNGQPLATLSDPRSVVQSVAFSPDGNRIAGASTSVFIWDVRSKLLLARTKKEANTIYQLEFSPDGDQITSCTNEPIAKVWDSHRSTAPFTITTKSIFLKSMAYSPNGKYVATCAHRRIQLWDTHTGKAVHLFFEQGQSPTKIIFSPDGKMIAGGGTDRIVHLWNVETKKLVETLRHEHTIDSLAFSPDLKWLAVSLSDNTIALWQHDGKTYQRTRTLKGHTKTISSLAFSPASDLLASASDDHTARIWDIRTGQTKATLKGHTKAVRDIAFHPNGQTVATASLDRHVKIWRVKDGSLQTTLKGHTRGVTRIEYSPSGQRLVTASLDGTLKFWDVHTEEEVLTLHSEDRTPPIDLAFDQTETTLACCWGNGLVHVYRAPRIE